MLSGSDIVNAKVLIVDDQEANVRLLVRMLENAGYTDVAFTMDPHEVCDLHRRNRYHLILLDLQMPELDGFQVMERLKELEIDGYLSVLAITAEPAHKLRALQAGAKDFVSKPFDLAEVLVRVHNLLEVRLLHDQVRSYNKSLESLALQDPLTGLANRRSLAERLLIALAHGRKNKSSMAVLYLDLDGFKQINEQLGHGVGDALLKMVADRLVAAVRVEDTVARLGGDEFMIALWHVGSTENAALVASKLIEAVSRPYAIEGHTVSITTSVGIGVYPVHGEDSATLMDNADLALFEAKHAGKKTYRFAKRGARPSDASCQHRSADGPRALDAAMTTTSND